MKYNIDKKFGIWRYMKSPLNKFICGFGNTLLSIIPKHLNTKDTYCSKFQLSNFNIYIISPKNQKTSGILMYFHGGAFCFKGGPNHFKNLKEYIKRTNLTIVYVDYIMAYKSNEEICINNCLEAYKYILNYHKVLGFDLSNIGFAGDSAGGYISLRVINECFKQKIMLPKYQMLIYPVVSKDKAFNSLINYTDTPMWNSVLNKKMWSFYANNNFFFDPLLEDISYMPPTYIEVCEFDCLHDEGVMLYNKLTSLNVTCFLNDTLSTMHGYDVCFKHPIVVDSFNRRIEFLKKYL